MKLYSPLAVALASFQLRTAVPVLIKLLCGDHTLRLHPKLIVFVGAGRGCDVSVFGKMMIVGYERLTK